MKRVIEELLADLENWKIPEDFEKAIEKIKCPLNVGDRIYWYYVEDQEYFSEMDGSPRDYLGDIFSGIIVPVAGLEYNGGEIDIENLVVVVFQTPTEKSYPETDWVALKRLIDDEKLIEIFSK